MIGCVFLQLYYVSRFFSLLPCYCSQQLIKMVCISAVLNLSCLCFLIVLSISCFSFCYDKIPWQSEGIVSFGPQLQGTDLCVRKAKAVGSWESWFHPVRKRAMWALLWSSPQLKPKDGTALYHTGSPSSSDHDHPQQACWRLVQVLSSWRPVLTITSG